MSRVVCDCSVTAAWCLADESSVAADQVLAAAQSAGISVPAIWPAEMANVLWAAERRGRIEAPDAREALDAMSRLPIRIAPPGFRSARRWFDAAREHSLSAYDASYLDVAARGAMPLATFDRSLAAAARAAGIELFHP